MTPVEVAELVAIGLGLVGAFAGGSKLAKVRAARRAKREAMRRARGG